MGEKFCSGAHPSEFSLVEKIPLLPRDEMTALFDDLGVDLKEPIKDSDQTSGTETTFYPTSDPETFLRIDITRQRSFDPNLPASTIHDGTPNTTMSFVSLSPVQESQFSGYSGA